MITGIAHAAFGERDMRATLAFYCEKLGFAHAFSLSDPEGKPWIEYVKVAGGQFLEFFYRPDAPVKDEIFRHICLAVDDAEAECARLAERGVPITSPVRRGKDGNLQFWTADPDGTPIEFMQICPESMQAKS